MFIGIMDITYYLAIIIYNIIYYLLLYIVIRTTSTSSPLFCTFNTRYVVLKTSQWKYENYFFDLKISKLGKEAFNIGDIAFNIGNVAFKASFSNIQH